MKTSTFEKLLGRRLDKIRGTLGSKAKEYATDGDRLHNFKAAGRMNGESPSKALWGMATKHLVSVVDMVQGRTEPTEAMVDEKVGDMINYLILLEAVFADQRAGAAARECLSDTLGDRLTEFEQQEATLVRCDPCAQECLSDEK